MPRSRTKVDEERVELAKLEAEALDLKIKGKTYEEIGEAQECSKSTAYERVHRALRDITLAPATELKTLEARRLEALIAALWPVAMEEKGDRQIAAVRELRKLSESLRKLHGLDAPVRRALEVFTHDDFSALVARLEAELEQNDHKPQPAERA